MKNNTFNKKININKCENEHLLCCIVMISTQFPPRNVSEKPNKDNKKQALFEER